MQKIKIKNRFTFGEKADKRLRREEAMEVAILGAIDTAASDFTSDICKKNTNSMSPRAEERIGIERSWTCPPPPCQTGHTSN